MALRNVVSRGLNLSRQSDLILAALVVGIVGMMIIPLPTFVLDVLITTNISLAVVLLLVSIYIANALKIAAFPSILLITTLFRLGLNVSSTRLILIQADAGDVIQSFGNFVVAGNLVVGGVIFLILTLIQFIVIAKGSERVAEVAARFTLDAMPGKQMAIDADVRSGAIEMDEARRQRAALQRESQMYGSMDGAMKFVKGDAIAGILITLINIGAGLLIGVFQRGMAAADAARVYSLLTIGDGLVSQIPALLISTAAGIVVTRVASEDEGSHLGRDIGSQILAQPRAIAIASGLLVLLALVPGLPFVPFLVLAAVLGSISYRLHKGSFPNARSHKGRSSAVVRGGNTVGGTAAESGEPDDGLTQPRPIALEVGENLVPHITLSSEGTRITDELIPGLREMLYVELGIILPGVNVRAESTLAPNVYRISLTEVPVALGEIDAQSVVVLASPEMLAAQHMSGAVLIDLPGVAPPACRVASAHAEKLEQLGMQVVDPPTAMVLHLGQVVRSHAGELLGIQETQHLLDGIERTHPALVSEVLPKLVSVQTLADVLRRLLEEEVSIRDMRAILEGLAEAAQYERDPLALAEYVRRTLRRQISYRFTGSDGQLSAFLLDPGIEEMVREAIQRTDRGSFLALDPEISREISDAVASQLAQVNVQQSMPVILTGSQTRRYVRRLLELDFPDLAVLSYDELLPTVHVMPLARISMG